MIIDKNTIDTQAPKCSICGKQMINAYDSRLKKISKYLWKTNCEHMKDLRLGLG